MNIATALQDRENNFTLMRFFAAFAVLFGHSYDLSQGQPGSDPVTQNLIYPYWGDSLPGLSVGIFFVTSGFLVGASYIHRQNLMAFIEARALRILPALCVAVLFCVFVGLFVTTVSISDYLSSPSTWSYIRHNVTLVSGIQYDLLGVFVQNPFPDSVNGSLWTLPIEIWMYFWVAVLGGFSILKGRKTFNLFFVLVCLLYAQSLGSNFFIVHEVAHIHLAFLFMLGTFCYVNREEIPLSFTVLIGLGLFVYLTTAHPFSLYIKSIFFAYLVLVLALHPKLQRPPIDKWGDISYGLYIYAFPVQQTVAYLIPDVHPMTMFFLASLITFPLAILSWKFIEKPALKLKGKMHIGRYHESPRSNGYE